MRTKEEILAKISELENELTTYIPGTQAHYNIRAKIIALKWALRLTEL